MMKLFKLEQSVEGPIIGDFPQVQEKWPWLTDRWGENSYTMTPLKGRIEFDIVFPYFELAKRAKLTDWVSAVNVDRNYLMVSTRLLALLKGFVLDEYQYFPVPVHTPNKIVDYHLIYFPWPRQDDFINWEKSTFRRITKSGENILLQFENAKARNLAKDAHEIQIEKIIINTNKITMDVFRFRSFHLGFYVSERLKNAMESAGMTGIVYEIPEWLPK
ncbi:MAG: hypothetical protein IT262_08845 [Saprospiraceae bacterium]|nr:hypothetical protein [Saprospiraceae bacterium]